MSVQFKVCFFAFGCPTVSIPFVENTFPIGLPFQLYQKTIWPYLLWVYFWTLFCSTDLCVYPFANTTLSWYYSFIISLKIRYDFKCNSSKYILFQKYLVILVILSFHINFRSWLIYSYKKSCLDFDWNCVKSIWKFRQKWHLYWWDFQSMNMVYLAI